MSHCVSDGVDGLLRSASNLTGRIVEGTRWQAPPGLGLAQDEMSHLR